MAILILNCGSQSVKWRVFDKGFGLLREGRSFKDLQSINEKIDLAGHRVVHGGDEFIKPTKITPEVLKKLKKYNKLAPLHNPYNLIGIKKALKLFPNANQFAVFDTEFYKDLPERAFTYPLPENLRKIYRKFGFHGISHEYASKEAAKLEKKDFNKIKIISCHLGGGCSITAIKNGKAIDTSMGYTPMEGLMMMTRAGDIDPAIAIGLGWRAKRILNYESGIKGIAEDASMLNVLKRNDEKSSLALEMFVYRIQKYIGAYFAILGGCDLLVFTGMIGAGLAKTRNLIVKDLNILKNAKIIVVPPNEELAIAQKIPIH